MRLNLGCCDAHLAGYVNVDLFPPADQIVDLAEPWPWPDSSAIEIRAFDLVEHLPDKIRTMNEAWRVLVPGGLFVIEVPTTDGRGAFQDPTHVSYWTPNDLFYFSVNFAEWQRFHVHYGIKARFRVRESQHTKYASEVWKLRAVLEAIK